MNILHCSNWSAFSAYAQQSNLFVPRIQADGHSVTVFEVVGGQHRPFEQNGVQILGTTHDPLGNDVIIEHAQRVQADAVLTLMDVWRYHPGIWEQVPWYAWCPIDHLPAPPAVMSALRVAKGVIAMSRYGQRQLRDQGIDALYCPLAYDPAVFKPIPKEQAREQLGIPSTQFRVCFVGVNDSNPNRKGIPELLMAWQQIIKRVPEVKLYLHTALHGNLPLSPVNGVRIDQIMMTLDIPQETVELVDQSRYKLGLPQDELALQYAAADVLVLPSRGEGFGMPLIEAQACGTPVITTDFAAGAELVYAGWHVKHQLEWSTQDALIGRADWKHLTDCLLSAYQERHNATLRQAAVAGVEPYAIDRVYHTYMRAVLNWIGQDVLARMSA